MENIKITDLEVHTEMIVQHVRNGKFLKGVSQKKRNEGRRGKKKGGREGGKKGEKKRERERRRKEERRKRNHDHELSLGEVF